MVSPGAVEPGYANSQAHLPASLMLEAESQNRNLEVLVGNFLRYRSLPQYEAGKRTASRRGSGRLLGTHAAAGEVRHGERVLPHAAVSRPSNRGPEAATWTLLHPSRITLMVLEAEVSCRSLGVSVA